MIKGSYFIKNGVLMLKKRKFVSWLLFCLVLMLIFSGCGTKDLTKGKTPLEIVTASSEIMQKLKSYSYTMEMNMNIPDPQTGSLQEMSMNGAGKATIDPIKTYTSLKMKMGAIETTTEVYALVEDNKIVEYISNPLSSQSWLKMELPLNDDAMKMLNPANSLEIMKKCLVDAKIVGEEEENKVKLAVVEVTLNLAGLTDLFGMFGGAGLPVAEMEEALASMGNITYKMWVRKDNLYTTKMEMDLTEIFTNLVSSQSNEEMKDIFSNMSADMKMAYTDYDKPVEIKVPDEVKNSAQDMSNLLMAPNQQ